MIKMSKKYKILIQSHTKNVLVLKIKCLQLWYTVERHILLTYLLWKNVIFSTLSPNPKSNKSVITILWVTFPVFESFCFFGLTSTLKTSEPMRIRWILLPIKYIIGSKKKRIPFIVSLYLCHTIDTTLTTKITAN